MPEKYAVIGSGGREHALAMQLRESLKDGEIISLPGNPGMAEVGECFAVDLADPWQTAEVAKREGVDLALIGPEVPLVNGVADQLERCDVAPFGPSQMAARLEGSKVFMKDLMREAGIPTAQYRVFRAGQERQASGYYESFGKAGAVVKADGLAGGKGVALPDNPEAARRVIENYLSGRTFGEAGETIVIEERLRGREVSLMVLCDGQRGIPLDPARDYKRLLDGDRGPNTGGMGSFSPVGDVPPELVDELMETGVNPLLHHMNEQRMPFRGICYAGFMLTEEGPMVLEYNIRFGDPEAQVIVPRLTSDLTDHLWEAATGKLETPVEFSDDVAVTVALTAPGYPERPRTGDAIEGLAEAQNVMGATVFHGGTALRDGRLVTDGGRVLYVTGFGTDLPEAQTNAYEAADEISWPGLQRREEIGMPD